MAIVSVRANLDKRWKRVLFLFWVPLAFVTAAFLLWSMLSFYHVYIHPDAGAVLLCHRRLAMGSFSDPPEIYGSDYKTDDGRNTIAWYRLRHRFSDATREVERSGIFIECMSHHEDDGVYWANWDFVIENTKLFVLWTIVFGAIIVFGSRVYQGTIVRLWNWVNLK